MFGGSAIVIREFASASMLLFLDRCEMGCGWLLSFHLPHNLTDLSAVFGSPFKKFEILFGFDANEP